MIESPRNATCHVRIYDADGLVLSTNPKMDASDFAHLILDIIKEHSNKSFTAVDDQEMI